MPKVKARVKVSAKSSDPVGDKELSDIFNQMLGTGRINVTIAYPRYRKMLHLIRLISHTISSYANGPIFDAPAMQQYRAEMNQWADENRGIINLSINNDELVNIPDGENLTERDPRIVEFESEYREFKDSPAVMSMLALANTLAEYRASYENMETAKPKFYRKIPGGWMPFPFSKFDLVQTLLALNSANFDHYTCEVLSALLKYTRDLHREQQSPDIDVDKFVKIVLEKIDSLRNVPELSRCKNAFNAIRKSVDLFKDNFFDYYRDFHSSGDSTVIMQNFITDVANSDQNLNLSTANEFKQIIQYYHKMMKQLSNNKDSRVEKLMSKINSTFSSIGEKLGVKIENIVETDPDPEQDDEQPENLGEMFTGMINKMGEMVADDTSSEESE